MTKKGVKASRTEEFDGEEHTSPSVTTVCSTRTDKPPSLEAPRRRREEEEVDSRYEKASEREPRRKGSPSFRQHRLLVVRRHPFGRCELLAGAGRSCRLESRKKRRNSAVKGKQRLSRPCDALRS